MTSTRFDIRAEVVAHATDWAGCALDMLRRLYPHKLDHLILHEHDQPLPHEIHPVFSGCYDWHSSVHMHASLVRLITLVPDAPWRAAAEAHLEARLTPELVAVERRYAAQAGRGTFERPYGWAWLLKLQTALEHWTRTQPSHEGAARWRDALRPFADDIALRMAQFIGRSAYPVRVGMHSSSAFAMLLAREHAVVTGDAPLREAIDAAAFRWFAHDRAYPAHYEPSGADFLSPGLCEAVLMRRVLGDEFAPWWTAFEPPADALERWLTPAVVSDRQDPQMVHLDGLNLSRAWCLWSLSTGVPADTAHRFDAAAQAHWEAALPHITAGDFAATHWLVSFALLCVDADREAG